ncbi:MAG: hypothetical protein K0R75_219 [Paenibacillaceae bacterium]|jgi:uncharacterized membrane protein YfcA|nr:hypothetical protein [Paenibacillaceae bacterium]
MDMAWVIPIAGLGSLIIGYLVGSTSLGGFLLVPLMLIGAGVEYVQAVSIALLAMIPGGIVAAVEYVRQRRFSWRLSLHLLMASLPGLYIGLYLSQTISSLTAQRFFGVFLLIVTGLLIRPLLSCRRESKRALSIALMMTGDRDTSARKVLRVLLITALGLLAGAASTLAGVGGAIIFIPVLLALGMEPGKAVGTGIVTSAFIVVFGSAGHLLNLNVLPVLISSVVTAGFLIGAVFGAKTSTYFPDALLKWFIVVLCCLSAIYFLFKPLFYS